MLIRKTVTAIFHWLHQNLLVCLLVANLLALFLPGLGQAMRHISLGTVVFGLQNQIVFTLPMLMLSILLFNAGFGMNLNELGEISRRPLPLLMGLLANLLLPLVYIGLIFLGIRYWHSSEELGNLLTGFALIAAMPVAGASTAWSQNVNGNLALSLGMVMISTLLSPVTTPWVLNTVAFLAHGDFQEDLRELAVSGSSIFLAVTVIIPSLLGIFANLALGKKAVAKAKPYLKSLNLLNLLLLSYSNAALSLPHAFRHFDPDFLALALMLAVALCVIAFACGAFIAKLLKTDESERASLMFGLGMNNNGTGLVLSSVALADHPLVMLPIIFYNLTQQIMAGLVDRWLAAQPALKAAELLEEASLPIQPSETKAL